jgi:hypothetical protein
LLFGRRKRTIPPLDSGNIASRGDDDTETDAADVSFERFRFARRGAEDVP